MGKRSTFPRISKDKYRTPLKAVLPLLPHLQRSVRFAEPCAGDGRLIDHLERMGHTCVQRGDIEPDRCDIPVSDALTYEASQAAQVVITNPPWTRSLLHPLIERLSCDIPAWLLFDAGWAYTGQSAPFMDHLAAVVPVGRVKWIEDSPHTGKDDCCWYLFDPAHVGPAAFYGRAEG